MHPPKTNTPANGARQSEPKSSGIPIHSQASYPSADAQANSVNVGQPSETAYQKIDMGSGLESFGAGSGCEAQLNLLEVGLVHCPVLSKRAASVCQQPGHAKIARLAPIAVDFDGAPSINRRKFTEAPRGFPQYSTRSGMNVG
jgi:hypothetical protein